ncbi:DUF2085 domain-containing protein [Patescibacteria group bacterium]|nr:DUF2085 domain-containing protein [Patescibacteria group bacterium]
MIIKERIIARISQIGKKPICNLRCERTPKYKGVVFLFCYRCTGVIIGGIFAAILKYLALSYSSWILLLLLTAPLIIDGFIQKLKIKESNNLKRFVTGILFGVGLAFI